MSTTYLINKCSLTCINFKRPMEKGKLDVKHMKCFSISYLEGVKGYILWKTELIGPRGEN
ncbi:hypothetical protein MTR_5g068720 [Medicago truncatula]|uniref:Uncharacterized protein n=1 Tax=Medicago truncatula TaxID=3880 RepID=G7K664_MEDTR|nr:hypothetical protein MTR_5g068720 [Medicago truncatula]